jgi:tripartite ATP-independent transporter DctM subunit
VTIAFLIAGVILLLLLRVPVAFALLTPSVVYFLLSPASNTNIVLQKLVSSLDTFTLIAVPMFILMGNVANASGMSEKLFDFAEVIIGRVRYALGYVNIVVSFVFSWMSGTATADIAATGKIEVPHMLKRGYPPAFALGITGGSSILGAIMPPSIPAVVYAVTAGVSLGGMLIAGVLPALLITGLLFLAVFIYSLRHKNDGIAPQPKRTWGQKGRILLAALPPLLTPVIILGGILSGLFTPSEAAAISVVYFVVLGFVYKKLSFRNLGRVLGSSALTTGAVLIIVAASAVFGQVLAIERAPQAVATAFLSLTDHPLLFLLLAVVLLLIVGMFLEPTAGTLIMVPVLAPVAVQYGVDPLHFGTVVIFTLVIGLITPPVGLVAYILSSATRMPLATTFRGCMIFLPWLVLALLIVVLFPDLVTFLPSLMANG